MAEKLTLLKDSMASIAAMSAEDAGSTIKALIALADGDEPDLGGCSALVRAIFPLIAGQVERSAKFAEKQRTNGKSGGRPASAENPNITQNNPNETQNNPEETQNNPNITQKKPQSTEYRVQSTEYRVQSTDTEKVYRLFCETAVSLPRVVTLSEARKKAISARLRSGYTVDDFARLFQKAQNSRFLRGGNSRGWVATFDWLIKDANMAKVLEGQYDDRGSATPAQYQVDMSNEAEWSLDGRSL